MAQHKIIAHVGWTGNNFCCGWADDAVGNVAVTNKSLTRLKDEFTQSLQWHIEGCVADGDSLPDYLVQGDYEIVFELDTAALLREAEQYTTMAAISRASGINPKLLSHYANGLKHPRPAQRERIIQGIHNIGQHFIAMR